MEDEVRKIAGTWSSRVRECPFSKNPRWCLCKPLYIREQLGSWRREELLREQAILKNYFGKSKTHRRIELQPPMHPSPGFNTTHCILQRKLKIAARVWEETQGSIVSIKDA